MLTANRNLAYYYNAMADKTVNLKRLSPPTSYNIVIIY